MPELPTISDTLRELSSGLVTAETLLEATLSNIERHESAVHAHAYFDPELARANARTGEDGPLRGIPFGLKDVFDVEGLPTRCGSLATGAAPAPSTATIVDQLRHAGAVLVGKHTTHELTVGLDEPPTRNAWDHTRYPGGSTAGGGVAVAAGLSMFAIGTDAAGSVRIPACANGIVGLKPTWGRLDARGIRRCATAPSIDHVGVLARTVEDLFVVMTALDPKLADTKLTDDANDWPLAGTSIGVLGPRTVEQLEAVESDVSAAFSDACDTLTELGADVVEVEVPSFPLARQAVFTLFTRELSVGALQLVNEQPLLIHEGVRHLIELGSVLPVEHMLAAESLRRRLRIEMRDVFQGQGLAIVATPTMPRVAMPLATFDPANELAGLIPFTCPFNLTGQPALSIPAGISPQGIPIGLQLVGRPFEDGALIWTAQAYEIATRWHRRVPPMLRPSLGLGDTEVPHVLKH